MYFSLVYEYNIHKVNIWYLFPFSIFDALCRATQLVRTKKQIQKMSVWRVSRETLSLKKQRIGLLKLKLKNQLKTPANRSIKKCFSLRFT